jgi:NADPH:quinone reductase-like Zn-dependent oxidoreductase
MLARVKAAVVTSFDSPPQLGSFARPVAEADEALVEVKAAALTQLVRAQAAGKHYSGATPPLVPGADGVGLWQGQRVYFAFPRAPVGSMAECAAVKRAYVVPVPAELDDVTAAAAGNPGMASWAGLTRRASFKAGESVLVNGAAGTSGRLAIQVAKYLGARRVVATARDRSTESALRALGADAFIALDQPAAELTAAFRAELAGDGVDVVLDYLFGAPAEAFVAATIGRASGRAEPRIRFVQVGSAAGLNIALPGAALRSSGLELLGTGLGAVSNQELLACISELFRVYAAAGFLVEARAVPLDGVASAWQSGGSARTVFTL